MNHPPDPSQTASGTTKKLSTKIYSAFSSPAADCVVSSGSNVEFGIKNRGIKNDQEHLNPPPDSSQAASGTTKELSTKIYPAFSNLTADCGASNDSCVAIGIEDDDESNQARPRPSSGHYGPGPIESNSQEPEHHHGLVREGKEVF